MHIIKLVLTNIMFVKHINFYKKGILKWKTLKIKRLITL